MHISVKKTNEGSTTLYNSTLNEHYHSIHGALTESLHVFIQHGFIPAVASGKEIIRILEIGFGTGLNAALTAAQSATKFQQVLYTGLEPFPVDITLLHELKYNDVLDEMQYAYFEKIHAAGWNNFTPIHPQFQIEKRQHGIMDIELEPASFDVIYFDAFSPEKQPDLWEIPVLDKCYSLLQPSGIFITYCAKGVFKRNLKQCGFKVEARPGPPFKREITFALK